MNLDEYLIHPYCILMFHANQPLKAGHNKRERPNNIYLRHLKFRMLFAYCSLFNLILSPIVARFVFYKPTSFFLIPLMLIE